MCGPSACGCATADSTLPAAAVVAVLATAAVSSAAAIITGALLVILATLGLLSAIGISGLVYLLRRDRVRMWQPAPAVQAAARPALSAPRAATALTAPRLRAIAAARPRNLTAVPRADGVLVATLAEEMVPAGK
jgi:hypothetical protein